MRGSVFIEFASEREAETSQRACDNLLWPVGGNFAGIQHNLQQLLSFPKYIEMSEGVEPPKYTRWRARQFHRFRHDLGTLNPDIPADADASRDQNLKAGEALLALLSGSPQHGNSKKSTRNAESERKRKASKGN